MMQLSNRKTINYLVLVICILFKDSFGFGNNRHVVVMRSQLHIRRVKLNQLIVKPMKQNDPIDDEFRLVSNKNEMNGKSSPSSVPITISDAFDRIAIQITTAIMVLSFVTFGTIIPSQTAVAADLSTNIFDPSNFQPVCPASDGVYQVLKITANTLVGSENVIQYGPLIASVLLRIRLELCVLESFLYEAVIPFIQKNGISWVLPLHETVETFLAGTIFAVASNFILLGSTKILSVLFIYLDTLTGMPTRFIGKTLSGGGGKKDNNGDNGGGNLLGTTLRTYGEILGNTRSFLESADTFIGRYLVIITTVYIAFKVFHYKFFNDIFPF